MRLLKSLLLALGLLSCSSISQASFTPYPVGITDTGTVVLTSNSSLCPNGPNGYPTTPCYFVQSPFGSGPSYLSVGLPNLSFDNGGMCSGLPAGADPRLSRCNNGYYIFADLLNNSGHIFDGFGAYSATPDPRLMMVSLDAVVLNSLGQFAIGSGADEQDHFGSVLTPEPDTFLLLGTGLLSAIGLLRKRLS